MQRGVARHILHRHQALCSSSRSHDIVWGISTTFLGGRSDRIIWTFYAKDHRSSAKWTGGWPGGHSDIVAVKLASLHACRGTTPTIRFLIHSPPRGRGRWCKRTMGRASFKLTVAFVQWFQFRLFFHTCTLAIACSQRKLSLSMRRYVYHAISQLPRVRKFLEGTRSQ